MNIQWFLIDTSKLENRLAPTVSELNKYAVLLTGTKGGSFR